MRDDFYSQLGGYLSTHFDCNSSFLIFLEIRFFDRRKDLKSSYLLHFLLRIKFIRVRVMVIFLFKVLLKKIGN